MGIFKIKKGNQGSLNPIDVPISEDTLYICDNGKIFYDYGNSESERIELANDLIDSSNNWNIDDDGKSIVLGEGNIYKNNNIICGNNNIITFPANKLQGDESTSFLYLQYNTSNADEIASLKQQFENIFEGQYIYSFDNFPHIIIFVDNTPAIIGYPTYGHAEEIDDELTLYFSIKIEEICAATGSQVTGKEYIPVILSKFSDALQHGEDFSILIPQENHNLSIKFKIQSSLEENSLIIGNNNLNRGDNNIIIGQNNQIVRKNNILLNGENLKSTTTNQHIIGKFNDINKTGYLKIGGGTSEADRKDLFRVDTHGNAYLRGTLTTNSADYAEYFEWKKVPEVKDTRGLFVTLDKNKIRLANKNDKYILGIISASPGVIGNSYEDEWQRKYELDIFGNKKLDEKGQEILVPGYEHNQKYIPRKERAEWALVGLLGQIVAVDDGTCVEGEFCSAGENGIATAASQGYYVMERLDDNHIKVCVK